VSYEVGILIICGCLAGSIGANIAAPLGLSYQWTMPIGFALGLTFALLGLRLERKQESSTTKKETP
jgi:hypothetical protein